jgi:spore maturation protein CgeB
MRIFIVDAYYPAFLSEVYERHNGLSECSYQDQWRFIMDQCFGTADFYSRNLRALGHQATEVVVNCKQLQTQWARERGLRLKRSLSTRRYRGLAIPSVSRNWMHEALLAQAEDFRPDVVHIQDPVDTPASILHALRGMTRVTSTQIASPISSAVPFQLYDVVLSAFPHFVERFRRANIRSEYFRLGFEPSILCRLEERPRSGAVFVGGLSAAHAERVHFLSRLAELVPFEWWGYGVANLPANSRLRQFYRGEAWGLEMYDRLHSAKISINHHIDVAENHANNMRLYEATGVGSLLLTDKKDNLRELFDVGSEIDAYGSIDECANLIKYYLDRESDRAAVAAAGQARTLREHSYYDRMREFVEIIGPFL